MRAVSRALFQAPSLRLLRSLLLLVVVLAALSTVARSARADATQASTVSAKADALVRIQALGGTVHVVGKKQLEVGVHAISGEASVTTTDGGASVTIRVRRGSVGGDSSLEVTVPSGSSVEVRTVGGGVSVTGVTGRVQVESVEGSLDVTGPSSDVEAHTISGRVNLSLAKADVRASSVSGDVEVRLPGGGTVALRSVSGAAHVDGAHLARVEVRTVAGEVTLAVDLQGTGPFVARTHGAPIHAVLPKGAATTVETHTSQGHADGSGPSGGGSGASDAGHAVLSLYSFSGPIDVVRR
jgi:hypothetical protein